MHGAAWGVGILFLGLAIAGLQGNPTPAPSAVERALAFLESQPVTAETIEAFAAAGNRQDTTALRLPVADPDRPADGLRTLHALLVAGVRDYDDPARGLLHLGDELAARRAIALDAPAASTLGFWLLSASILDAPEADTEEILQALVELQNLDGGFPCLHGYSSLDCTGFAVAALAAHDALGRINTTALLAHVRSHEAPGGGYSDGRVGANAQSTAWAITIFAHTGAKDEAAGAKAWLANLQRPDGHFARAPDGADPTPWWATAEAIVALLGGHPIQPLAPN